MACHISSEEFAIEEASILASKTSRDLVTQEPKDYSSIKSVDDDRPAEKKRCCYRQKASPLEHVAYFCSLAVASYAGVFTRIYLTELVNWDGVPLFPSLYPQLVGTTIMGLITSHKLLLANSFVYPAIATGLCGSITTFSSWNSEAVSSLLQSGKIFPNNGVRVLGWVTTLLLGLGMSSGALTIGRHLATLSPWADSKQHDYKMKLSDVPTNGRLVEGVVFVCMWVIITIMVVVLPNIFGRRELLFSGVLGALGTYIRWHLSPLNSTFHSFKLGTFIANVAGAWLLGGVVCAQGLFTEEALLQDILTGVAAGLCGCLTTVSTFAVELSSLPLKPSYLYAISSIVLAQLGMILVRGTFQWTT